MDQVAFGFFWDIFALSNYIVIGADSTIAYAEVPHLSYHYLLNLTKRFSTGGQIILKKIPS